jgi:diguanylate cyclase (GGDEF)-like protein
MGASQERNVPPSVTGGALGMRAAHGSELVHRARSSALVLVVTALVVVPLWSVFDYALEPRHAATFTVLRLVCDIPILAGALVLWRRRPARPELVAVLVLTIVQCEIAWMVSRASEHRQFYLLGFTLALYASGLLLAGAVRWTVVLVGVTGTAFGICLASAPEPMAAADLVAAATYLSTSSIIAVLAHAQRNRLTTREFATRSELELEQENSRGLLHQLEQQSREDALTGLANRRRWDERLHEACELAHRRGGELAVVLLDVDRFKDINDRFGHAGGDEALRQVAEVLTRRVSEDGLVARLGGDELAVLLPGKSVAAAAALAERVRQDVQGSVVSLGDSLRVSVSQGVASASGGAATPQALMHRADRELYRAKRTRNAVSASALAGAAGLPGPRLESSAAPALARRTATEARLP